MVADLLPSLKPFLLSAGLGKALLAMALRMVTAFILHSGRMSCLQAAGAVRSDSRHRAQVGRMLRRPQLVEHDLAGMLRSALLKLEASKQGRFLLILDVVLTRQAGKKVENTFHLGNRQRQGKKGKKGRRFGQRKHARRNCHSFTTGLLITPSGVRVPFMIPNRTREYCQRKGLAHRTTAEAAADLIRQLPLPEEAEVVVLGDTAYDADVVRAACADRGYDWIFPCNPERVLSGPKPRPKVRSLLKDWPRASRQTIRLKPGQGKYVAYRRLSRCRIGPKAKPRTYYVHQERREVHSVGEVQLVFSTTKANLAHATPDDVKILMTNNLAWSAREIVELYGLRWQIELFFKELKSTLGFHQYRFQDFRCVESWCQLVLATVIYLEWRRLKQLRRRDLTDDEKDWWRAQRTYGLCQATRLASQQNELKYLAARLATPGGTRKLKRLLKSSFALEYQAAL